jgi:hypothetical protein
VWNQTIVEWSKRKVAWWYEKRSGRRCAIASWLNKTKDACGKENGGGENSGGCWVLLDEMHLLECKRRNMLTSCRQSKRGGQL